MKIYIEYLILDNLSANVCILTATLRAMKRFCRKNVTVASIVATLIGIIYPLLDLSVIADFLFKITASLLVLFFSNSHTNFEEFFKEWVLFLTFSFILGGFMTMILNILKVDVSSEGMTFIILSSCVVLLKIGKAITVFFKTRYCLSTFVILGGVRAKAMWDTGNCLSAENGSPVHVVSPDLRGIKCQDTGRKINVSTVSGSYMAELYHAESLRVCDEDKLCLSNVYFVYSAQRLTDVKIILNAGAKPTQSYGNQG